MVSIDWLCVLLLMKCQVVKDTCGRLVVAESNFWNCNTKFLSNLTNIYDPFCHCWLQVNWNTYRSRATNRAMLKHSGQYDLYLFVMVLSACKQYVPFNLPQAHAFVLFTSCFSKMYRYQLVLKSSLLKSSFMQQYNYMSSQL